MNSKSNLVFALAAVTSLALGLGISFWRAAAENNELMSANHVAEMALAAAQDETKALHEKLQRETKVREYAEAARAIAEHSGACIPRKTCAGNQGPSGRRSRTCESGG